MNEFLDAFRKFADFSTRSSRRQYWMFLLMQILIGFAVGFVSGLVKFPMLANLYTLALAVPGLACAVRRMHDVDRKGWWILVPIYGLYLMVQPGTPGDNRFGPPPAPSRPLPPQL